MVCCTYEIAAEQKARTTYDNLLRLIDDPDVRDPIKFLRQREVTHFQRFGEAKRFGKQKNARSKGNGRFQMLNQTYLEALAALIASIIIGTTLNRSPQMP